MLKRKVNIKSRRGAEAQRKEKNIEKKKD